MRSRFRKQPNEQRYDQSEQQQPEKAVVHKKNLSDFRDYMSMRANNNLNRSKKRKPPPRPQTAQMAVHQHLKPAQQPAQQSDNEQAPNDPISLLSNFNNESYKNWLAIMRERVLTEKPYTQEPEQLLDSFAYANCNVCVYGFGSKIEYLRGLVFGYFADCWIWEVNGFKLSLNDKKVYNYFGKFLIDSGLTKKLDKIARNQQYEQYKRILTKHEENNGKQLIILFHCIDGINFLDSDSQQHLSKLFSLPKIRLIASIDNIKISSIWHPQVKTRYNFRFFHIDTKVPNLDQQIFRPNTNDVRQKQDQAIMNIYQSLNSNQKRILKLFAKKQLDNYNREEPEYYTMDTLLEDCIDSVILSSDSQLRENLLELIDHKVIVHQERLENQRMRRFYTIKCNKVMLDRIFKEKIED